MSSTHTPDIRSLFEAAMSEYEKRAGTNLMKNELTSKLKSCNCADDVIAVLQDQAQAFQKYRGDRGAIMTRLKQAVNVLYNLSTNTVVGQCIGMVPFPPAQAIFAGIGVLLAAIKDVSASYDALVELFELIENFLRRLDIYRKVQSTTAMTEIVVKILAELLATLALATQQIKQGRLIKFGKKLLGEKDVEVLLQKLDRLTQEESHTAATLTLEVVHDLARNLKVVMDYEKSSAEDIRQVISSLQYLVSNEIRKIRDQSRKTSREWLSPPDPSQNQNIACEVCYDGTATWLIQGATFLEWISRGSLLWIHGKPGSGKSILCSTIIRHLESMQDAATASMAFFYFDFRDDDKRNRRGLLASLLVQFSARSDDCCDILSRLYSAHGDGLRQPSDQTLLNCLEEMLTVGKLGRTYIIVDAIDECPKISGTPSSREKVLDLVTDLIKLRNPNLRLCVTSRPEADVWTVLLPLVSHSVSLHDEMGQKEDINNYISFFVNSDRFMNQWRKDDRNLVINKLRQEAAGMFRWVFCQLDKLRRCLPGRIRSTLDELPRTLDMTYERTLQDIDEENWGYAHRLFQCIAVASRPLRVEELAEFLAIDFDSGGTPTLVACWRPEDPSNAVLSTCSSLIAVVTVDGRPVVQFSHFSVQEFLMSGRLSSGQLSRYYISLEPAHATVAQACLSVLLQLDNHIDKRSLLEKYPLSRYAAQHWLDHIKFPSVSPRAEFAMIRLFDQDRPHYAAWVWIYVMDQVLRTSRDSETPLQPNAPPIYHATLWDLPGLAEWLATVRSQEHDVNEQGGYHGTPLCAAAARGCLRAAQVLLKHGADVDAAGRNGWSPLLWASDSGRLELSRLMLDHGADINFRDSSNRTSLSLATGKGHLDIAGLLLQRGANANVWESGEGTVLMKAIQRNHLTFAQLLLTHGADVNARNNNGLSLLDLASGQGNFMSVQWLLKHGAKNVAPAPLAQNNQGETFLEGDRRIMGAFLIQYFRLVSIWLLYIIDLSKRVRPSERIRLTDIQEETQSARAAPTSKRRALLVGISYHHSPSPIWYPLENPHGDVDCLRELLINTYGYAPDDITVLKDDPKFPESLQPTRVNMIIELTRLVLDAAPGDKFIFFYSGHADQQISSDDRFVEEDSEDEVIITSDIQRIVDNELNDILVKSLPDGTFLLAVFDTCHSGTMLDLPHYHCNNVYVPWHSKGQRVTMTMRNNNVRHHAMGLSGLHGTAYPLPSIVGMIPRNIDSNTRLYTDPLPAPSPRLRIDTKLEDSTEDRQTNERWRSIGSEACPAREGRPVNSGIFVSPMRYESPVTNVCDGWCEYNPVAHRTALSLSVCSDPQRAWESPQGSLTTVLCRYLKEHPRSSYHNLMSHVNFALHENSRDLHTYTRQQKKDGCDFDGELDNFQEPKLSSLWKLNMDEIFQL